MNDTTSLIKSYKGKNIQINPITRLGSEQSWTNTGLGDESEYRLSAFFESPLQFYKFVVDNNATDMLILEKDREVIIKDSTESLYEPLDCILNIVFIDTEDRVFSAQIDLISAMTISESKVKRYESLILEMRERQAKSSNVEIQKRTTRNNSEFVFESQLAAFLQVNEIHVERQVRSMDRIIDLWIPSQLIIELKIGKVSGNDACQAIDYLDAFGMDILLIGTGLSRHASRAIEATNKMSSVGKILFVTKDACFGYLKGVCK